MIPIYICTYRLILLQNGRKKKKKTKKTFKYQNYYDKQIGVQTS